MEKPWIYEIRIAGQLHENWSDWFEGLAIDSAAGCETTLRGTLPDQAALLGVLAKLQALNLTLISVTRLPR